MRRDGRSGSRAARTLRRVRPEARACLRVGVPVRVEERCAQARETRRSDWLANSTWDALVRVRAKNSQKKEHVMHTAGEVRRMQGVLQTVRIRGQVNLIIRAPGAAFRGQAAPNQTSLQRL